MKASSFFEEGKHDIVQVGRNFRRWFGDLPIIQSKKTLSSHTLDEYMSTDEIMRILQPSEVSLSDIARIVEAKTDLIRDRFNVFFVRDTDKVLRIVDVYWSELGWCICSRALEETIRCIVGRVFSSEPFLLQESKRKERAGSI